MELEGLEQFLLTADEVGEGFLMQESGAVRGAGVGHMCPDAGVSFDEFVAMRAWIVKPSGDDEIAVEELLWTDDTATLDQLMTDLEAAFAEAAQMKDEYVSIEHILLAIIDEKGGRAREILNRRRITRDAILKALMEIRQLFLAVVELIKLS